MNTSWDMHRLNINQKFIFDEKSFTSCALGRCEKLIIPPIIMNNILKVAYLYKKNNKIVHLTLGGLGITALSDLLDGKKYKGFSKFIKEKYDICNFNFFNFITIS
jgi:hypothetical protein